MFLSNVYASRRCSVESLISRTSFSFETFLKQLKKEQRLLENLSKKTDSLNKQILFGLFDAQIDISIDDGENKDENAENHEPKENQIGGLHVVA